MSIRDFRFRQFCSWLANKIVESKQLHSLNKIFDNENNKSELIYSSSMEINIHIELQTESVPCNVISIIIV